MRFVAPKPHTFGLAEGENVDGYVVEDVEPSRSELDLIYDAVGPEGEAVSVVMSRKPPLTRHARTQFRRAARLRASLRHPALLPVRAVGEHAGRPYLAMDRYPPTSFGDLLEGAPLSPRRVLTLLAPVCDALDMAHAQGLVHQHLSGTSLLLEGEHILLDGFGVTAGSPELSSSWVAVHDVRYSSPEALRGEALAPASNVYSLASLLVHGLTGTPPYEGAGAAQTYGHLVELPPEPSRHAPELGLGLDRVIADGMAKDPKERPGSARELLDAAAAALDVELPASNRASAEADSRANGYAPGVAVRASRTPKLAGVAAVAAAAVAGLAAGVLVDPFEGSSSPAARAGGDAQMLERLDDQRTLLRARLSAGETPQEQAGAAVELADAYGQAARAAESRSLVTAARAAERAYADLGAAAEDGSAARFASLSGEVASAEQQLAEAQREL